MTGQQISGYITRFDSLSLRERVLLLVAVLVLVHLAWIEFLWEPMKLQQKREQEQIARLQNDVTILSGELKGLVNRSGRDPNVVIRQDISEVKRQVGLLQQRIADAVNTLITPEQMAKLLERLLTQNESLQLVELKTLESPTLDAGPEGVEQMKEDAKMPEVAIFEHGFSIVFKGDYLSTLEYLKALEELPWRFFWDGIEYSVEDYPRAQVKLLLHTLSLSEGWIGVKG